MTTIVWFRQDLRIEDNPALLEASLKGDVVPLFIWAPDEEGLWAPGPASRWWLENSLKALDAALTKKGAPLLLREGNSLKILLELIDQTKAKAVAWNRRYEPVALKRDKKIKEALSEQGIDVFTYQASLLIEPWEIKTKNEKPYQVFTPFWKALQKENILPPLKAPSSLSAPQKIVLKKQTLSIAPPHLSFSETWKVGEHEALRKIKKFVETNISNYQKDRDEPALEGTSRQSPHLHFGEISPRQIWALAHAKKGSETYLKEMGWREFAYHLLYHFPQTPERPLREKFASFPWEDPAPMLDLWKQGRTGYPIVDAGMRQLLVTGWMHNRVRMIVASFLTKDLLIPWQEGAKWFWETLVDADLANNTLGWQWVSGCGADAAPYFRIFNPVTQGMKFDPQGLYIKRWIPELKDLPVSYIHTPWEAPKEFNVDYPEPIIDHSFARTRALDAFNEIKNS